MSRSPRSVSDVLRSFDRALGIASSPKSAKSARIATPPRTDVSRADLSPPAAPRMEAPRGNASRLDSSRSGATGRPAEVVELRPSADVHADSLLGSWELPAEWLTDPGSPDLKLARLAEIRAFHDQACPHCTTATTHQQTVFGEGNPAAEIVFVGEAPGETEDQVGRPFVGRAGQKLDEMIRAMGLARADVYIANALKSRPPDNRTPLAHEVAACGPFLMAQLLAIRPRAIVTLGGPSTKLVLGETQGITRLRGNWRSWMPPEGSGASPIPVMPTYHPAYVLRNYTAKVRGEVWSDLKSVLEALGRPVPRTAKDGDRDND